MKDLYFVTSSDGKLEEFERILGTKLNRADIDVKEIQAIDVEEVVEEKVKEAYKILKKPVMVEDTGYFIEAFEGFPGALIKWVLKTLHPAGICKIVGKNRKSYVKTNIGIYNGRTLKIFNGRLNGKVAKTPKGSRGFGWDCLFIPNGSTKTFGQIPREDKDRISMRKIALMKAKRWLEKNKSF